MNDFLKYVYILKLLNFAILIRQFSDLFIQHEPEEEESVDGSVSFIDTPRKSSLWPQASEWRLTFSAGQVRGEYGRVGQGQIAVIIHRSLTKTSLNIVFAQEQILEVAKDY